MIEDWPSKCETSVQRNSSVSEQCIAYMQILALSLSLTPSLCLNSSTYKLRVDNFVSLETFHENRRHNTIEIARVHIDICIYHMLVCVSTRISVYVWMKRLCVVIMNRSSIIRSIDIIFHASFGLPSLKNVLYLFFSYFSLQYGQTKCWMLYTFTFSINIVLAD